MKSKWEMNAFALATRSGLRMKPLRMEKHSVNKIEQHASSLACSLSRQFGKRMVVQEISLDLKHGEVLGFLGPNGAGKSTLMRMLAGNLGPESRQC